MHFKLLLFFTICLPVLLNAQELDCRDPEFVGGHEALMSYISANLSIPDNCIGSTNSTKLNVKLVVDGTGGISHAELYKAEFIKEECVEAITAVFYSMPKWIPGKTNGKPANKVIFLPITLEFD